MPSSTNKETHLETIESVSRRDIEAPESQLLSDGWKPDGLRADPNTRDDLELCSNIAVWTHDTDPVDIGIAKSEQYSDDGYPWVMCTLVENEWKLCSIASSRLNARNSALHEADHREYIRNSPVDETYDEWIRRTGGTRGTPEIYRTAGFP